MSSFTRKSCFFLITFVVVTSMAVYYYTAWTIEAENTKGMDLSPLRTEELQQRVIPMVEEWNSDRKAKLREVCNRIGDAIPHLTSKAAKKAYTHIIVDRQHRVMYCPVPKAACTTWKVFFMNLRGVKIASDIHTQERSSVVHFSDLDSAERETVLNNYKKLIIVRHPFTRLLSAYRNKIEPNGTFESTHLDNSNKFYWRNRVGNEILKLSRGQETAKNYLEHPEEYELTFREFVEYISTHKKKSIANDRHWKEMFEICFPCDIEYDFIAKVETLSEDSIYFLISNGFSPHLNSYWHHATNSTSLKAVSHFYNELPVESIETLYQRYKYDFQLFDYDPRNFT